MTWPPHDGGGVAARPLQQSLAAGRQVVGHGGPLAPQAIEVDDVEVGPQPGRDDAPILRPTARALVLVSCCTNQPMGKRPCGRSRPQCVSVKVGKLASEMMPTCAPPSPSPKRVCSLRHHFVAAVEIEVGVVRERGEEEVVTVVFEQEVERHLGGVGPAAGRLRFNAGALGPARSWAISPSGNMRL